MNRLIIAGAALAAGLASCASPKGAVRSELVELGLSDNRAACVAEEFSARLEPADVKAVANFLKELNKSESAGNALDALLRIDNPRAAAVAPIAGVSCAIPRRR